MEYINTYVSIIRLHLSKYIDIVYKFYTVFFLLGLNSPIFFPLVELLNFVIGFYISTLVWNVTYKSYKQGDWLMFIASFIILIGLLFLSFLSLKNGCFLLKIEINNLLNPPSPSGNPAQSNTGGNGSGPSSNTGGGGGNGPNPGGGNGPNPGWGGHNPNPGGSGQGPNPEGGGHNPNPGGGGQGPNPEGGGQGPNPRRGRQGPNPRRGRQGPNPRRGRQGPDPMGRERLPTPILGEHGYGINTRNTTLPRSSNSRYIEPFEERIQRLTVRPDEMSGGSIDYHKYETRSRRELQRKQRNFYRNNRQT